MCRSMLLLFVPVLAVLASAGPPVPVLAALAGAGPPVPHASVRQPQAGESQDVYVASASLLRTMVHLPADYGDGVSHTLVVGLHGHGDRQPNFFALPAPFFHDAGIIYAVPQAPYAFSTSNGIGYSWNLRDVDDRAADQGDEVTIRYILDVVAALRARYDIGDVYLMGFSQGGTFTYRTAIANHEAFTGFATFGSGFNEEWFSGEELAAANRLRAFVAGGTQDSFGRQERAHASLQAAGYDVTLYEFDAGHTITRAALEELIDWVGRVRS